MGSKRIGLARVEAMLENLKRDINWGTATFTHDAGTAGSAINSVRVVNSTACVQNSDSEVTWTQPANTVINAIYVAFPVAPVLGSSGDIGVEVGTASGGGQIITQMADEALDGGTTITAGAVIHVGQRGKAADGSGGPILNALNSATTDATSLAADGTFTAAARTIYLNTVTSNLSVTTAGTAVWIVEYMYVGA